MPLPPETRLGAYQVVSPLGAGGMGEVYRATDTKLGREVALKLLPAAFAADPDRLARFEREAKVLASLNHSGIAHLYGFESATLPDGSTAHFLAMELAPGEDLSERLNRGKVPLGEALEIAKQIAEALEEAHEKGIVHRDLKPANVKLAPDGRVKVLDFGLARAWSGEAGGPVSGTSALSESPTLAHTGTAAGLILGTAAYMSPEQARGKAVDKRADIWAFGVVLFEMLAGKRLFDGETVSDVLASVLKSEPDWGSLPPTAPWSLRRMLERCLQRDPRRRLRDIGDARIALEEALSPGGASEAAATAPGRGVRSAARLTALAAAGALAVGLAVGHLATKRAGAGSALSEVSFERLTFRPGHFANARFASDGETVFLSADWDRNEREVFQVRPKAGELALGLAGAELLSVSASGELAVLLPRFEPGNPYVQVGTLAVVSASGGTPRELADGVMAADWAPDGKSLAVLRVAGGTRRLEYPLGTLLYASPNDIYCPRVSPKGDEVVFFEYSEKGVAVTVVDRSGAREVLSGGWPDWWLLAWSPAGDEVWFGASVSNGVSSLFAVDRLGKLRTLLAAPGMLEIHDVARGGGILAAQVQARAQAIGGRVGGASERNLSWLEDSRVADISPDGALALLSVDSERESGVPAAYLRSMDGSPPVRLGAGRPQELSRDGRWALAIRGDALVALPTAAGEERVLATGLSSIVEARWLPDGLHVLVVGTDPDGSTRLKQIGFEGGPARTVAARLELRPAVARNTRVLSAVSPDGRFVAAATASGEIAVLSLDGGEPRPVPGTGPNDLPVRWSADGRRVFLLDPSQLPARVYAVDAASGKRELWREIRPPDRVGVAGVEAVALTPDATAYVYSYRQYRSDLYLVKGLR